ncbi:ClpXP protease specificity-enhancing factor [Thiomicrorhabdus arctica]|jgi:stringent starvation protein B|uniref:ClpXP protease specificity-enhancing factor n=1 Tax=Thiomicrorhabdus arctica TaxID=131540 RepID=UPI0003746537|nr:ClpXP protease specificity-enhancing factor [Thiomicrorhabdus arctica]
MISNRSYIIRAMYDWIVDNNWTPHVQVDAHYPGVDVPQAHVQEGVIVLNLAPSAVVGLSMKNDWFTFKARFGGIETTLNFPPEAVLAIFARENGQGMPFPPEPYPEELLQGKEENLETSPRLSAVEKKTDSEKSAVKSSSDKKKPSLSIVK